MSRLIYFIHITNQNFRQIYPKPVCIGSNKFFCNLNN